MNFFFRPLGINRHIQNNNTAIRHDSFGVAWENNIKKIARAGSRFGGIPQRKKRGVFGPSDGVPVTASKRCTAWVERGRRDSTLKIDAWGGGQKEQNATRMTLSSRSSPPPPPSSTPGPPVFTPTSSVTPTRVQKGSPTSGPV